MNKLVLLVGLMLPLFILASPQKPTPEISNETPSLAKFKSEEAMAKGWYHRHEHDSWVRQGAKRDVIDALMNRIKQSSGERRDSRYVDSQRAYGPGNWVFEWAAAGDLAMNRAEAFKLKGKKPEAYNGYREALAYFTIASWPHLGRDEDKAALRRARKAYMAAGNFLPKPVQHVEFAIGDNKSKAYLHLPPGEGPFPLLIYTFGSDVTKEDGFGLFADQLLPRNIALMLVDLPGIGEAAHIDLLEGSDQALSGARDYALQLKQIDSDKIFVAGASFGGNAAARAFFKLDVAGVISMCGPLHSPFFAPAKVYDQLPALTIDGVKSRIGMLGSSSESFAKRVKGLSLKKQGLFRPGMSVKTPLLILTTNKDPVAPLEDLSLLQGKAENVETVVLDMVGHCPPRWVRQPIYIRWMMDQMAANHEY